MGWLDAFIARVKLMFFTLGAVVAVPFQRPWGPSTVRRHILFNINREFLRNTSLKDLLAQSMTTDEAYAKYVSDHGLELQTITLQDGTRGHWLGDPAAERVMFYFHGGGYAMYASEAHFELLSRCIDAAGPQGGKLAVLLLSYDLSATAPYPRQLQQASLMLHHLLHVENRHPEQIILAGDSAGGNLALALLSHILHPHPQVTAVDMVGKFAGAALLSPWVTFNTVQSDAFRRNMWRDILSTPALDSWGAVFRGTAPSDHYLEPLHAPLEWWQGLPVDDVLVLAGADELFVDDIEKFATQLGQAHPHATFIAVPDEAHDFLVMEFLLQEPACQQRIAFQRWLSALVGRLDESVVLV